MNRLAHPAKRLKLTPVEMLVDCIRAGRRCHTPSQVKDDLKDAQTALLRAMLDGEEDVMRDLALFVTGNLDELHEYIARGRRGVEAAPKVHAHGTFGSTRHKPVSLRPEFPSKPKSKSKRRDRWAPKVKP